MSKFLFYYFFFSILFLTNSFSDIIEKVNINGNKRISDQTIIVLGNIKMHMAWRYNGKSKTSTVSPKMNGRAKRKRITVNIY